MNNTEQPISQDLENLVDENLTDNQATDNGSANLGKFKDVDSLLKAYNSLQTEFTKKSQRLSELENSKTEFTREEKLTKAISELEQIHVNANKFSQQLKNELKEVDSDNYAQLVKDALLTKLDKEFKSAEDYIKDTEFLNNYIYNNDEIKDNIIRGYLHNLTNTTPVKVVSNLSSSIPVSPPNNPSTIQEAGRLAKNIIKQI